MGGPGCVKRLSNFTLALQAAGIYPNRLASAPGPGSCRIKALVSIQLNDVGENIFKGPNLLICENNGVVMGDLKDPPASSLAAHHINIQINIHRIHATVAIHSYSSL